jgi:hypothetical protein
MSEGERMRAAFAGVVVVAVVSAACGGAGRPVPSAPSTSNAPSATPEPALLAAREAAWRAYFAGDEATLGALLPPEFIGLDMGPGPFGDRTTTLADSREFHAGGGRLVRLAFPETRAQRHGDVVVLYGRFEVVLETAGEQRTFRGRLTEVFVWRDGRWSHPGWHLDLIE